MHLHRRHLTNQSNCFPGSSLSYSEDSKQFIYIIYTSKIQLYLIQYSQMGSDQSQPSVDTKKQQQAQAAAIKQKKVQEEKFAKKIQVQKLSNDLDQNVNQFENKQRKLQAKIDILKEKAKELLDKGNQKDARKLLEEATRVKKQLEKIQVRRKLIANKKDQLETHEVNRQVIDAMEAANQFTKEDLTGKLEQHMIAAKQNKLIQDEINNRMKEMVENSEDEEATDELMKELQNQVVMQNKKKIEMKNPTIAVAAHQTNLNKKQVNKNEDIDQLLADL